MNSYDLNFFTIRRLNIALDAYKPEWIDLIEQKIVELSQKIDSLKKSMYIVYGAASDDQKKQILSEFIKERGWTSNLSAVKKSRKNNNHPGKSLSWARKLGQNN